MLNVDISLKKNSRLCENRLILPSTKNKLNHEKNNN
jgi:hypothetical protein